MINALASLFCCLVYSGSAVAINEKATGGDQCIMQLRNLKSWIDDPELYDNQIQQASILLDRNLPAIVHGTQLRAKSQSFDAGTENVFNSLLLNLGSKYGWLDVSAPLVVEHKYGRDVFAVLNRIPYSRSEAGRATLSEIEQARTLTRLSRFGEGTGGESHRDRISKAKSLLQAVGRALVVSSAPQFILRSSVHFPAEEMNAILLELGRQYKDLKVSSLSYGTVSTGIQLFGMLEATPLDHER